MPIKPTAGPVMTLEEFEAKLADGDRWLELVDGRLIRLDPPDELHGDVVRNLSRPLAVYMKKQTELYAVFSLSLVLSREPATVRCPAVSCFASGNRFDETEKLLTETKPVLVIEVASTNDRRDGMAARVKGYLDAGITAVWVIDPVTRHVHQFHQGRDGTMTKEPQVLQGWPILPGFTMPIRDLFQQPPWAQKAPTAPDEP